MNIFAFAILPVMFSVHTIVSWDFAVAIRPGWASTIFGPYFVVGALQSGIAAVAMVVVVIRSTMKNIVFPYAPSIWMLNGKLMLIVSMACIFLFNGLHGAWFGG
jgi:molybdopterin-containing oxidoreductase family membrane subunit